ncbi:MAG: hypothetical protein ACYTBS_17940, partial [Planctomycetota bacterium]
VRGRKYNTHTMIQDGTAAGPNATAFVVILVKPKVGTKMSITRAQRPNFDFLVAAWCSVI